MGKTKPSTTKTAKAAQTTKSRWSDTIHLHEDNPAHSSANANSSSAAGSNASFSTNAQPPAPEVVVLTPSQSANLTRLLQNMSVADFEDSPTNPVTTIETSREANKEMHHLLAAIKKFRKPLASIHYENK